MCSFYKTIFLEKNQVTHASVNRSNRLSLHFTVVYSPEKCYIQNSCEKCTL